MNEQMFKKWLFLGALTLFAGILFPAPALAAPGNALNLNPWSEAVGSGLPTTGFAANNAMTIEAWVHHDALSASRISRYVTVQSDLGVIRHNSGNAGALQVYFKLNGAVQGYTVNDLLQTGRWYHVAGVWNGAEIRLYLDGKLVGAPLNQAGKTLEAASGGVKVGHTTEYLDGRLDEVRIYNIALSQAEIQQRMYGELTGSEPGLIAYYRMDESSGAVAADLKGNANLNLNVNCSWVASTAPFPIDFGDAPVPYPVTIAEGGAVHGATGPSLGAKRITEGDGAHGQPLPAWLSFDPFGITYSGKAPWSQCKADFTIRLQAFDGCSAADNTFQLKIWNQMLNHLKSIGTHYIKPSSPFSFSFAEDIFVDPDGETPLHYQVQYPGSTEPPLWISFDASTRTFSGLPPAYCNFRLRVSVLAYDSCGEASLHYTEPPPGILICDTCTYETFDLFVTDDPPTVHRPNPDRQYRSQTAFSFSTYSDTFSDDFGADNLEYSSVLHSGAALPEWLHFDPAAQTWSGTTPDECATWYYIDLVATDNCGSSATDSFYLRIIDPPPDVDQGIPDQQTRPSTYWEYIFPENAFSDPEGAALNYEAEETDLGSLPYWLHFDSATRKFYGAAPAYQTNYSITVWAKTGCSDSTSTSFTLYINSAP